MLLLMIKENAEAGRDQEDDNRSHTCWKQHLASHYPSLQSVAAITGWC